MKNLLVITLAVLSMGLTACSTQWREADPGISSDEMFGRIQDIMGNSTSSVGGTQSEFLDIINNDYQSVIYFADGPGPIGSAKSVAAFYDFEFLGKPNLSVENVESALVAFAVGSEGRYGLLVSVTFDDGTTATQTFTNTSDPVVSNDTFDITMSSGASTIHLRTYDVKDGAFKDVIQMIVGMDSAGGEIQWNGKFSTLVGFAP